MDVTWTEIFEILDLTVVKRKKQGSQRGRTGDCEEVLMAEVMV